MMNGALKNVLENIVKKPCINRESKNTSSQFIYTVIVITLT